MQYYKSLCVAAMISVTLVNTQTHRQLLTGCTINSVSGVKQVAQLSQRDRSTCRVDQISPKDEEDMMQTI